MAGTAPGENGPGSGILQAGPRRASHV